MLQLYGLKTLVMSTERAAEPRASMESTVLIVDDDPAAVEFLKTVISHSTRVPAVPGEHRELRVPGGAGLPDPSTRRGPARPDAARRRRHRRAACAQGHRPGARGHRDQRAGHDQARAGGRAGGRLLLHREVGSRPEGPARPARPRRRPGRGAPAAPVAAGTDARAVLVREHPRQEQAHAVAVRAGGRRGGERRQRADSGRERHRQGAVRQRHSSPQPSRPGPVHQDQLRGAAEGPDRVRAVRLQEGRVHRRHHRQGRPARAGPRAAR